ncbi:MAG TPA: SMI1/KNR4 family protein [Gemmataceae bacterium]|nr:SMI1/KNR4 family protein [Gemmataceae bacterium]
MGGDSLIGRISYRDDSKVGSYSIKSAWQRLKRWSVANVPQLTRADCPPALEAEIRKFEDAIGQKLPKDVRASYRIYNGQCAGLGIVFGLAVDPLQECLHNWTNWINGYQMNVDDGSAADMDARCSSFPAEFVRQHYFDRGWIPLTSDFSGNHIGIDLNPGPRGTRGQVIIFGRDDELHSVLALSWGQFLTDLADELQAGNWRLDATDQDYPNLAPDDTSREWHRFQLCQMPAPNLPIT